LRDVLHWREAGFFESLLIVFGVVEVHEGVEVRIDNAKVGGGNLRGSRLIEKVDGAKLVRGEQLLDGGLDAGAVDGGEGMKVLAVEGNGDVVVGQAFEHGSDEFRDQQWDVAAGGVEGVDVRGK
jgi:hypothetical protein